MGAKNNPLIESDENIILILARICRKRISAFLSYENMNDIQNNIIKKLIIGISVLIMIIIGLYIALVCQNRAKPKDTIKEKPEHREEIEDLNKLLENIKTDISTLGHTLIHIKESISESIDKLHKIEDQIEERETKLKEKEKREYISIKEVRNILTGDVQCNRSA